VCVRACACVYVCLCATVGETKHAQSESGGVNVLTHVRV